MTFFSSLSVAGFSPALRFMPSPAIICEEAEMTIDYMLGALVTAGLLAYLVYALIRPERF